MNNQTLEYYRKYGKNKLKITMFDHIYLMFIANSLSKKERQMREVILFAKGKPSLKVVRLDLMNKPVEKIFSLFKNKKVFTNDTIKLKAYFYEVLFLNGLVEIIKSSEFKGVSKMKGASKFPLLDCNGTKLKEGDILEHCFYSYNPSKFPEGKIRLIDGVYGVQWGNEAVSFGVQFNRHLKKEK